MTIIIHKTSISPPARAVMMLIRILNLKVEIREVNLPSRDQFNPKYLKKNPLHTVPLLEDDGFLLADSHAIMTYLVSQHGPQHSSLYPESKKTRAIIDQRLYFEASILFPRFKPVIYNLAQGNRLNEEQRSQIVEAYGFLEKYLEKTEYVAEDYLTLADISCVATLSSLHSIVPVDRRFEKVHRWWNRMQREDWYEKENVPGMKLFNGFIKPFLT